MENSPVPPKAAARSPLPSTTAPSPTGISDATLQIAAGLAPSSQPGGAPMPAAAPDSGSLAELTIREHAEERQLEPWQLAALLPHAGVGIDIHATMTHEAFDEALEQALKGRI